MKHKLQQEKNMYTFQHVKLLVYLASCLKYNESTIKLLKNSTGIKNHNGWFVNIIKSSHNHMKNQAYGMNKWSIWNDFKSISIKYNLRKAQRRMNCFPYLFILQSISRNNIFFYINIYIHVKLLICLTILSEVHWKHTKIKGILVKNEYQIPRRMVHNITYEY